MAVLHAWPRRPPTQDKRSVGVSFVDVLFALVVANVLEPFADLDNLTGPGIVHLVLAGVLTLSSWVGYHNSLNRPSFFIRFPNLPLFQFLLDIGMVVVYWLVASTAETSVPIGNAGSEAWPETLLVLIAFAMYVAWDLIALQIRNDSQYFLRPKREDEPLRRRVTWVCAGVALAIHLFTWAKDVDTDVAVYVVDVLLIALLIGFRLLKEYVTPENYGLTAEEREYRGAHDDNELAIEVTSRVD